MSNWLNMVVQASVDTEKKRYSNNQEYQDYSITDFLNKIQDITIDAIQLSIADEKELAKEDVRKIAALASLCMETHGFSM